MTQLDPNVMRDLYGAPEIAVNPFPQVRGVTPDAAAKGLEVQRKTGVDAILAAQRLPEFQDELDQDYWDRLVKNSPQTAKFMAARPVNAALLKDEVSLIQWADMGITERVARQFAGSVGETLGRELHGFGELANVAQRRITAVAAAMLLPEPTPGPMGLKAQQPTAESLVGPQIGDDWSSVGKSTMEYYRRNVLLPTDQQSFSDQVVGGLGQVAGQILLMPFDRGAGLYAQGASVMAERVQNAPASQFNKDMSIVGAAAVTGVTEKWALDKLLGPVAVPIKNKIVATLARIGIGAAAEGGQEFTENVLNDMIHKALINKDTEIDLGQAGDQAAVGGAVGGIVRTIVEAGLHVKARGDHKTRQAQAAEENAQAIESLAKLSQDSKLRQRAPDVFQQFVQESTQGGPLENVFISAQTLAQSAKLEQIKAASPTVAEQFDQAMQTGGDVRIPVAEFATHIAGPGYAEGLVNELKTESGGMTRTEAQAYTTDQAASIDAEIAALVEEKAPMVAHALQTKAIQLQLADQLNEAGRFSPSVNEAYAQLPAAFFDTMSRRLGGTPAQLFQEYAPNIVAEGLTGGPMLSQDERGGFVPREFTQDGQAVIGLFKGADLSSFLHESGHYFLETFSHMAKDAPALQGDLDTLVQWMGVQDTATWQGMSLEDKRTHHETFARGFETYLAEGKAPSLQMQGLFSRFRDWLVSVYRNIKGLNVELSPEVRAVMNRMLATDEHIAEAEQARGMTPLFTTPDEASAHGVDWQEYQQLGTDSTKAALAQLEARSLRDMSWTARLREQTIAKLNKEAKGKRTDMMGEVAAEVMGEPVYQVQRWLKKGILPDGSQTVGAKLSTTALADMYGDGPATPRRYLATNLVAADGLHPDVVAEMFGFKSGDAMVRKIVDALPFRARVDAITDQRMLEQYGDMHSPDAVAKAADEAIHNEVRTRFIATELTGLQKAVGGARVAAKMAKDYATQMLAGVQVGQIRPTQYAAAEVRAGKAAGVAMKTGDTAEAIKQKRFQLINHTATAEAYKVQDEVGKTLAFFKTVSSGKSDTVGKTRNMDIVNAARAVLAEHGVGMRGKNPRQYMEAVKAYDPELFLVMEPMLQDAENNAQDIKDLTVGELRVLRDNVESLWYLAKRERQVEIDGQLMDRETVKDALVARLQDLGLPDTVPGEGHAVTESEKTVRYLMGVRAALRRVESWTGRMDSGKIDGAFRKYLFTPISEAADRYRTDAGTYLRKYRDLLKAIEPTLKSGRIDALELGYTFGYSQGNAGKAELLHAILHTGNESNKRKMLLGRGWATESAEGVLDANKWDGFISRMIREGRLTKSDFDFAQGVWDLLEEIKPLAQKTHRQVFGRYFDEITAEGFTNQFGSYAGGYVPAISDTFEVQDSAIRAELEAVNQGNAFMFPSTSRGFTKTRVEYNKPLALDLRLLPQHIDKALLFAHMEPHIRDVTRTLRDKAVATSLNRYDATAYSDLLLPWLNRAARQTVETPATGWGGKLADKFFRSARSRAGMAAMFANLTNALQQVTGLTISAIRVKPSHLKEAAWHYMRAPAELAAQVAELSPFMANRQANEVMQMRQEIDDLLLNPNKYEQAKAFTAKHAYFLQSAFQNVVDNITWSAAFDQATSEGMAQGDAVRHANAVVRETQGSLSPEDISRFEAGPAFTRMFTQFTSYFNMQANLLGSEFAKASQDIGLKVGAGRMLYVFTMGLLLPAWFSEAIVQTMRGWPGDDNDNGYLDEFLAFFLGAPARNLLAMTPVVGQGTMLVANSFNNKPYDDRMSTAPAISMIESSAKAPNSVYMAIAEDGKASRAIRDTLTLVSMLTGLPMAALGKPLGYAADVAQGRVEPTGAVDAARGMVTGYASAESKQ